MSDIPPTEQPIPPVAIVVPVPTTDSPVAKDVASDLANEARDLSPGLPPPGTDWTKFTESSGFRVAVGMTVVAVNAMFVRPWMTAKFGETNAMLVEMAEWAWLAAFGIQRTDTASLRAK